MHAGTIARSFPVTPQICLNCRLASNCGTLKVPEGEHIGCTKTLLLGLLAVPLTAQSLDPPELPGAAAAIKVIPSMDVKLKYHFLAVGKQIYKCENGAWSKSSTPDAALYDMNSNLMVRHQAGPTRASGCRHCQDT